jgi:hypothetical protein
MFAGTMMLKTFIQFCIIVFIVSVKLWAIEPRNLKILQDKIGIDSSFRKEPKPYYFCALYGKNNLMLDDLSRNRNITALFSPYTKTIGPGLIIGYIEEENNSSYKDSFYYIQPFLNLPFRYLSFKLGMNIFRIIEGEGPGFLYLPAFEIKLGKMDKFFFSAGLLSELFFGLASININYLLKDNVSSFMVGRIFAENGGYSGYIYKIVCVIIKKLLIHVCGNVNFQKSSYGTQFGFGFLFK